MTGCEDPNVVLFIATIVIVAIVFTVLGYMYGSNDERRENGNWRDEEVTG